MKQLISFPLLLQDLLDVWAEGRVWLVQNNFCGEGSVIVIYFS